MSDPKIEKLAGLAVVTGASSGIGLELARLAAADGCAMILVARGDLSAGETACREAGAASVETVNADLSTPEGVEALVQAISERPVAALFANAGAGHGGAFLDQGWDQVAVTINTNVTGTLALIHHIGRRMRERGEGRILVVSSIVAAMPGPFNLTYNSTKAFIDDFTVGLANELKDTGIIVASLLPGATETAFFEKADMQDTPIGRAKKADPAKVARDGYDALLSGKTQVVSGFMNKVQFHFADILPDSLLAQMHRKLAKPDREDAASG